MKRILIIEDDKNIAELERDYLEANGFSVAISPTGEDGLSRALKEDFNLVLLDIMLPGTDGFSICRSIREHKEIPVLFVSAKREDVDKIRGLGLGADDYITKPFSPSELAARVKAHIARYERLSLSSPPAGERLTQGDLVIDIPARRVFTAGREVTLTNKEFDLLAFLARHPNQVFSKDLLFDRIWGMDSIGETSTVTVHVNRIREKIEPDPSKPRYIETIWGAGYRFHGEEQEAR